jgi:hypothetical protein
MEEVTLKIQTEIREVVEKVCQAAGVFLVVAVTTRQIGAAFETKITLFTSFGTAEIHTSYPTGYGGLDAEDKRKALRGYINRWMDEYISNVSAWLWAAGEESEE